MSYNDRNLKSLDILDKNTVNKFDACAIITDHSNVDYNFLLDSDALIIDTRNVFQNKYEKNIKRLGQG